MQVIKDKLKDKRLLPIMGIILLAVFFRFFSLSSIPSGIYPDSAAYAMDAVSAYETGDFKVFYPANNGREGLYMNIAAVVFKVFGVGLFQFRMVGALIGVLTVLGIYFLGKEAINKNVGLFASLFAATSFWAVGFSRIGFRAIMVPLVLVWASYFLIKAFNLKNFLYYILAGLVFGLGFHTYIAYKAVVLLLPLIFGYKIFFEKGYLKENWLKIGVFGLAIVMLAAPILYYEQTHKKDAARTGQVSVFNPAVNKGNLIKTLAITTTKGLGMYNFYGDPNSRHNYKGLPALSPIVGVAFLIGLFLAIKTFFSKIKNRDEEFFTFSFLLFSFFTMMLPSILTEEGMPHSLRAIGTLPFAFVLAGIGAEKGLSFFKKKGLSFLIPVLLVIIIFFDFFIYFQLWAKSPETRGQFNESFVEASKYLNLQPESTKKYVIVNTGGVEVDGLPVTALSFKFMTYGKSDVEYLTEETAKSFKQSFEKDSVIILAKHDDNLIKTLDMSCPNGSFYTYNPDEPNEFYVYKISRTAMVCNGN